jgi:hypothetical protein
MKRSYLALTFAATVLAAALVQGSTPGRSARASAAVAPPSAAFQWTEWRPIPDGQRDGVDIRFREGTFKYDGGNHQINWQFRNRYPTRVRIVCEIVVVDVDGKRRTLNEEAVLDPMEPKGSYTISHEVVGFRMKSIRRA